EVGAQLVGEVGVLLQQPIAVDRLAPVEPVHVVGQDAFQPRVFRPLGGFHESSTVEGLAARDRPPMIRRPPPARTDLGPRSSPPGDRRSAARPSSLNRCKPPEDGARPARNSGASGPPCRHAICINPSGEDHATPRRISPCSSRSIPITTSKATTSCPVG